MANKDLRYVITLDTEAASFLTRDLIVQSVLVIPSADSHLVVLNDKNGNEIFRNTSAIANHRTPGPGPIGPTKWEGLVPLTLTNVTRVFIYCYFPVDEEIEQ